MKLDSRLGAVVRERRRGLLVLGGLLPVGDREKRLRLVVAADDELGAEELLRGARVVWWRAVAGRGRGALDSSTLTCFFAVWLSAAPIVSSGPQRLLRGWSAVKERAGRLRAAKEPVRAKVLLFRINGCADAAALRIEL